jgi:hypothetical protein
MLFADNTMSRSANGTLPPGHEPLNTQLRVEQGWFAVNVGERGVYSKITNTTTVYKAHRFSSGSFERESFLEIIYPA